MLQDLLPRPARKVENAKVWSQRTWDPAEDWGFVTAQLSAHRFLTCKMAWVMPALPPSHAFTLKNQHPFHKLSIHSPVVRYRWSRIALVIYFFTLTVGVNGDKLGFTVCVCVCVFCCSLVFDQSIDWSIDYRYWHFIMVPLTPQAKILKNKRAVLSCHLLAFVWSQNHIQYWDKNLVSWHMTSSGNYRLFQGKLYWL